MAGERGGIEGALDARTEPAVQQQHRKRRQEPALGAEQGLGDSPAERIDRAGRDAHGGKAGDHAKDGAEQSQQRQRGGEGGKQLKLSLLKKEQQGPFWACLVRGHPEVETNGMKKEPMSTEQIQAPVEDQTNGNGEKKEAV